MIAIFALKVKIQKGDERIGSLGHHVSSMKGIEEVNSCQSRV
jgi:hypothetical protein